jgi:phenolic acid decarboxylase
MDNLQADHTSLLASSTQRTLQFATQHNESLRNLTDVRNHVTDNCDVIKNAIQIQMTQAQQQLELKATQIEQVCGLELRLYLSV